MSIMQFVGNVKSGREEMAEMILNQELLLMHELHYQLTVHNPLRPLEGLFIDIKVRWSFLKQTDWGMTLPLLLVLSSSSFAWPFLPVCFSCSI